MRMRFWKAFCIGLLLITSFCRADVSPDIVERGKRATALVEVEGRKGFGTAFCVDPTGFFVTHAHVLGDLTPDQKVSLVLNPGERSQKSLAARVLRQDKDLDLALLRVQATQPFVALVPGVAEDLRETQDVITFGYSSGKEPPQNADQYPNVTVRTGHITGLRKREGKLVGIQLDTSLDPGNARGPILNLKGRIIGIVGAEVAGGGIPDAIPVTDLYKLLAQVQVTFSPPTLLYNRRYEPQQFLVRVETLGKAKGPRTVTLVLSAAPSDHRIYTAHTTDGSTYTLTAPPVPVGLEMAHRQLLSSGLSIGFLEYRILVEQGGHEVGQREGYLALTATPTVGGAADGQELTAELLVSSFDTGEVKRYDARSGASLGSIGRGSGLTCPHELVIGLDGSIYVSCDIIHAVKRFDGKTGMALKDFVAPGSGGLNNAIGMAFGPDGNLYVCSALTDEIKRYDGKTGAFMDNFVARGQSGLGLPQGVTFGPDGNLYVCSSRSNQVKRYNGKTGVFMDNFAEGGGLASPHAVVFGPDGSLYVTNYQSNEIKRYNGKTGAFIDTFITAGSGGLRMPYGLAFGPDGNLYVCGWANGQVKRYNGRTGAFLGDFVTGGLAGPTFLIFRLALR